MNIFTKVINDTIGASTKLEDFNLGGSNGIEDSGEVISGDVNIMSISMISEDKSRAMNIIQYAKELNIYESILSPLIFAEITISDSINLLQNFPIIGEEFIVIKFKTPSNSVPATFTMRVNKVKDKTISDNNKQISYTLELVSEDLFKNSSKLITKKLNDTVSDSVKDILTNDLGTKKKISMENTRGIAGVLISNINPFKAIDMLRRRAISKKYASSSYVFFENKYGYNFVTIEKLFEDGLKANSDNTKTFFFDTVSQNMDLRNVNMRNILAYNQISFVDSVSKIQGGGITNTVSRFDLLTGDILKINYTNNETQDKFKYADSKFASTNSSTFDRIHGKTPAVTSLVPYSSENEESFIPEKISILKGFVNKISQNLIQVLIYGDTDLTVGDVIRCNFPSGSGMTEEPTTSRLDSGNYLISKVRHIVLNTDRPQHTMSLELIKGSFLESI